MPRHTSLKYKMADGYIIGVARDALGVIVRWKGMMPERHQRRRSNLMEEAEAYMRTKYMQLQGPFYGSREIEIDHTGAITETVKSRIHQDGVLRKAPDPGEGRGAEAGLAREENSASRAMTVTRVLDAESGESHLYRRFDDCAPPETVRGASILAAAWKADNPPSNLMRSLCRYRQNR